MKKHVTMGAGMLVGGLVATVVGLLGIPPFRDQALIVLPFLLLAIGGMASAGAGFASMVRGGPEHDGHH